jgi:L-methionine (R)-S-oxide reductase
MTDSELIEALRREVAAAAPVERRAGRAAELIRAHTGRRWVGIYRVTTREVRNLGWSGPAPPAYPAFPADQGLTGAAVRSGSTVVSNDVATDPRYLTNQDTTGSELIVPILIAGAVVGTLDVEDPRTSAFEESDVRRFERLAGTLTGLFR